MSAVTVKPVANKADQKRFLEAPFSIYSNDKNWVAPLFFERFEHLSEKKNPYFKHAKAQLFTAEKNGRTVGRISAQICQLHLDRYKDACGQFGFLEAENDPYVFAALFKSAEDWLRQNGMKKLRGPFSFSINDESGLLIDGFNTPPNMMMGHAAPYYQAETEKNGYRKAKDLLAYVYDPRAGLPASIEKLYKRGMASGDIAIRPLNKSDMKNEIQIIMSIFNDAWSNNWGYVPFTNEELQMLATNLKLLVHKQSVQIASYKGENAAFIVAMPNLNEWFTGLNGKLMPFGWTKLVGKLISKKADSFRVPLMGVRKKFQDGVLGSALSIGVIKAISDFHVPRGAKEAELSWILEDNMRMRHILDLLGAKPYKTYRIYEKQIAPQ